MRILLVTQYFWPETFRINDIADELMARGHDVTVLTGKPNYPQGFIDPAFAADPARFAHYGSAEVIRVPTFPRGQTSIRLVLNYLAFLIAGTIVGAWRLRGHRFDAIFAFQTSPVTQAIPGVVQRRLKSAPLLMWVLDAWPDTLAATGVVRSKAGLALAGAIVRWVYRRCDRILVQSRAFADNVRTYAGSLETMRYFPNWPEPTFANPRAVVDAVERPEMARFAGKFVIMFAGNIGTSQDFPAILDAADRLRGENAIRWVVLGDGRAAPMVRSEIAARGLEEQVHLLGSFPTADMPAFFRSADCLLVSLRDEPIFATTVPGKVQSYLAAGRPILAMLGGEGAKVVRESGAGIAVPSGDSAALAEAALTLAKSSTTERAALGVAGRSYCDAQFSRDHVLDDLERWLREVTEQPDRPITP